MKDSYKNFWKATHCSVCFLGLYLALYSLQNIQSSLLADDGLGSLGFTSNAIAYAGQFTGALVGVVIIAKINDRRAMFVGSMCCFTFTIAFIAPSMDTGTDTSFWVSTGFISAIICITSFINGLG